MRSGRLLTEESPENLLRDYNLPSLENVFLKLCMKDEGENGIQQQPALCHDKNGLWPEHKSIGRLWSGHWWSIHQEWPAISYIAGWFLCGKILIAVVCFFKLVSQFLFERCRSHNSIPRWITITKHRPKCPAVPWSISWLASDPVILLEWPCHLDIASLL